MHMHNARTCIYVHKSYCYFCHLCCIYLLVNPNITYIIPQMYVYIYIYI